MYSALMNWYLALCLALTGGVYSLRALETLHGPKSEIPAGEYVRRTVNRNNTSEGRELESCSFPLEILLLQDTTFNMEPSWSKAVSGELQQLLTAVDRFHPHTSVGLATFRDKPVWPHGDPELDYCVKLQVALTRDADRQHQIISTYEGLKAESGGDPAENQFGALLSVLGDEKVGWGEDSEAVRLVYLITNSVGHYFGDGTNLHNLPPLLGPAKLESDDQCRKMYYPTLDMLKQAREYRGASIAFLVIDDLYYKQTPLDFWRYINTFLGQHEAFVQQLNPDGSNWFEAVHRVLDHVEHSECPDDDSPSTATAAQLSSSSTTTAATTSTLRGTLSTIDASVST